MTQMNRTEASFCWEGAENFFGALKAFFWVCGMVLFRPVDFFKTMAQGGADFRRRMVRAFIFAVALGYFKLFCDAAHLYGLSLAAQKQIFPLSIGAQIFAVKDAFFTSSLVFLRPLVVFLSFLGAVMFSMKLVLGVRCPLAGVFLAVCYASAAQALCLVPVVGGVLSSVWFVALLTVGIRELYRIKVWQSVFAAVFMPLVVLFFSMLSMGSSLNKTVVAFYPEAQVQLVRLNDLGAYVASRAVVQAAQDYKKELGFYPAHLGALKKYLPSSVLETFGAGESAAGYIYRYQRVDDTHFTLEVSPEQKDVTGRFIFFADENGRLRLGSAQGRELRDIKDFEGALTPL